MSGKKIGLIFTKFHNNVSRPPVKVCVYSIQVTYLSSKAKPEFCVIQSLESFRFVVFHEFITTRSLDKSQLFFSSCVQVKTQSRYLEIVQLQKTPRLKIFVPLS